MAKSLQDILKRRQQGEFVGREEQLSFFHRNLRWEIDDPRRRFIINVSGQGGVGKTWLLRRFRKIAEEFAAVNAYTDEIEEDIPSVMGHVAEQCEAQKHPLKTFAERYKVYRQRRQEIEADPDAPQGFPAFLGRTLAKGGLRLARRVPVGGTVADFVDEEAFAELGSEFASYVARKIGNKDEVQLVLEPVEVLSPLFLADLRGEADKRAIALFFDTYERTGAFLDSWLRDLLEGRYGDVPANILFVIAGRDALDHNLWAPYEGLLARLPLDPFIEEEAREYLSRKGITDEQVIEVILRLSGGLPLLVATLAAESPDDPAQVGDPSGEAVERFLRWVEDPKQRKVALDAALPRRLNRDVLAVLVEEDEADVLFAWLREVPFVEKRDYGWTYHEVVRGQMLRYKRQESPQGWANLHGRLAGYYEKLRDDLGLEEEAGRKDETWQGYALEALYHCLCQAPQTRLTEALNGFMAALKARRAFALRWAAVIGNAGEDIEVASVQDWGRRLVEGMNAYDEGHYQETSEMFTPLLEQIDLEVQWRAAALDWRGFLYYLADQYAKALRDLTEAIKLAPEEAKYWADQGLNYRLMERHQEALADFERALELKPDYSRAIVGRGIIYTDLEQYEEALADFERALELKPDYAWAIVHRGITHRAMEQYEEALADFERALELKPDYAWAIVHRGITHREMKRYEEALADFERALELKPDDARAIAQRGITYRVMERYEEALADFEHAFELKPDNAWAIVLRGIAYREMKRYEEALADFERALELNPNDALTIAHRGTTYQEMERYDEALADYDWVLELDPDATWAIGIRGDIQRQMERYEEALADFDRAIELDPEYAWAFRRRGITYRVMERYEEALTDFDRAIELNPDNDWYLYNRAITYHVLDQTDKAQVDLTLAILRAREAYEQASEDWRNTLNLALYHLAAGEAEHAERFYREALSGAAPPHRLLDAMRDLEDFLHIFPNHVQAQAMRDRLQQHLQEAKP
jgi:tetratricopeptide (TPR) repeat protein